MSARATPLRVTVVGAAGRMGRMLVRAVAAHPDAILHAALEREGSTALGQDAGLLADLSALAVAITADAEAAFVGADAVLDFTAPAATVAFAERAAAHGLVHVIGTTGLEPADLTRIEAAARRCTIVRSGNFSFGVILLAALVKRAARALDPSFDIEIVEMHHRMKVDAPSGTAILLGEAAAEGRGVPLSEAMVSGRHGQTGARDTGAIGFAALRGGSVVGDHTVMFAGAGERLELRHVAEDRGLFAAGAVKAALWVAGRPPGIYSMNDVLGLTE